MQKRNAKKGLATLCIGGGMGIAMCVEAVERLRRRRMPRDGRDGSASRSALVALRMT